MKIQTEIFISSVILAMILSPVLYAAGKISTPSEAKEQPVTVVQSIKTERVTLDVKGMKSNVDQEKIQKELKQNPGIVAATCQQTSNSCNVEFNSSKIKKEDVAVMINKLGFQASLKSSESPTQNSGSPSQSPSQGMPKKY